MVTIATRCALPLLALVLLLVGTTALQAQYINKTYYLDESTSYFTDAVVDVDSQVTALAAAYDFGSGGPSSNCVLSRVDATGNTLWHTSFAQADRQIFPSALMRNVDGYLALVEFGDELGAMNNGWMLVSYNAFGDTIWTRDLHQFFDNQWIGCAESAINGDVLIGGWGYNDANPAATQGILARFDRFGVLLCQAFVGDVAKENELEHVVEQQDGTLYWSYTEGEDGSSDAIPYLIKTSSTLELHWQKALTAQGPGHRVCQLNVQANGNLIGGGQLHDPSILYSNAWLFEADSSGTILWGSRYGKAVRGQTFRGLTVHDDYILAAGNSASFSTTLGITFELWMVKTARNGDSLDAWFFNPSNTVPNGSFVEDIHHAVSSANGGLVLLGVSEDNSSGGLDAYLVATDAFGCSDTSCAPTVSGISASAFATLDWSFGPVPVQSMLRVECPPGTLQLRVLDAHGRSLFRHTVSGPGIVQLATADWPSGVLVLELENEDGRRRRDTLLKP